TDNFKSEFSLLKDLYGDRIKDIDNANTEDLVNEIIPYWYPSNIPLPSNSDKELFSVECLWTKKQLIALSILWKGINEIQDPVIKDQMKLVFSATIARVNVTYNLSMTRQVEGNELKLGDGGSALFAQYRYWRPESIIELPVWARFEDRFKRVCRAKEKWNAITDGIDVNNNYKVIHGSALELSKHLE